MDRRRADSALVAALDRGASWCAAHWLGAFNLLMAVYVAPPFTAPLLAAAGSSGWTRGLPFWAYLLLSLPIAIDGGTALFELRESTPLLGTVTGGLFGLATAWFVYPLTDRALAPFAELPARASEVS